MFAVSKVFSVQFSSDKSTQTGNRFESNNLSQAVRITGMFKIVPKIGNLQSRATPRLINAHGACAT